jgi:glutamyl-tRNA reductase
VERYLVVGTSFRESDGALRDVFHLPPDSPETLRELYGAMGVDEVVYIATCNRVELVIADTRHQNDREVLDRALRFFADRRGTVVDDAWRGAFHVHRGASAVRHLFRVTSSLDSMVVGEAQILGQVKRAYHASSAAGIACSWLECLFEEAFRCARRIRRDTSLGTGSVSMATLAVSVVTSTERAPDTPIVLVGSGEMTSKVAMFLSGRGFTNLCLVNRTPEKVRATAERHGARVMALEAFLNAPPPTDVIVTATSAPNAIFTPETLAPLLARDGRAGCLLMVDLAAPRDTDPALDGRSELEVVTIDDLREESRRNTEKAATSVEAAKHAVVTAVDGFPDAMKRRLVDMICVDPVAAGLI